MDLSPYNSALRGGQAAMPLYPAGEASREGMIMSDSAHGYEIRFQDYAVSSDPARLDLDYLYGFLSTAYWHQALDRDRLQRSIDHSINFGLYDLTGGRQIGFARVASDRTSLAYVADVFVDAGYRGGGLGQRLMAAVHDHPELQGLRRWMLTTRDAHRFYERLGYARLGGDTGFMMREP